MKKLEQSKQNKESKLKTMMWTWLFLAFFMVGSLSAMKLDRAHSQATFMIKYLLVSEISGKFNNFSASLELDGETIDAFSATAQVKSIDTQNDRRDAHLLKNDYFAAKKYPMIEIKMVSFTNNELAADVTIRDVTKRLTFASELVLGTDITSKKEIAGLTLRGNLNRKDFNVGNKYPNAAISEDVSISLSFLFK